MEIGNDGVAVITISNPPVNALAIPSKLSWPCFDYIFRLISQSFIVLVLIYRGFSDFSVIAGLKDKFEEANRRNDVKAIVLTGELGRELKC